MKLITPMTVAEISVIYRPEHSKADSPVVSSSKDAHNVLRAGYDPDTIALQESFIVAYMNRANRVLGLYKASSGGITGTVADPRLILATALKIAAVSMILSHCHPSGSLKPSHADEELTQKIINAAKLHDIKVLDHIILSPDGSYYSFADNGLL